MTQFVIRTITSGLILFIHTNYCLCNSDKNSYMSMFLPVDSMETETKLLCTDTINLIKKGKMINNKKSFFKKIISPVYKFLKGFSSVDVDYIEPQKYNYTLMLQNTNTYEYYRIVTSNNNDFQFSPVPSIKVGPYVGWRWLFLGYTFDIKNISKSSKKTEFDISIYSSQIGLDFFYRRTGNDYRISHMSFGTDNTVNLSPMNKIKYDGINVGITGFNLYYIFNHKKFSYPAAFSQSTIQRRSCGSALCGIGYTRHSLNIDWGKLYNMVGEKLGNDIASRYMDYGLQNQKIKYTDISISGGYAYNWVFAHNWLAAASISTAVGYKGSSGNSNHSGFKLKDFSFQNFNIDGVGRFGIVWNNMRWYSGMSTIVHTYNYRKSKFYTNTIFGSVNIYVGINFGKK